MSGLILSDVTLPLPDGVVTKECKYRNFPERKIGIRCPMLNRPMESLLATITGLIPGTEYDFCFAINGVTEK